MNTTSEVQNSSERHRFLLGLVMALSISLIALEWGKRIDYLSNLVGAETPEIDDWMEEMIPITRMTTAPPPPPKQPRPTVPPQPVTTQIIVASNDLPEPQTMDPSDLPDFDDLDALDLMGEEVVTDNIPRLPWALTEQPSFPGGDVGFRKFMDENLEYPRLPRDLNIGGTVQLSFVIGKDGKIIDESIKVLDSPHDHLSREAIRVLKKMPKWNPGKQGVYPVPVFFKFPVRFRVR